ncbi:MAG: hypothetical protein ACP5VF_10180 [Acidobacteriota bacterium]
MPVGVLGDWDSVPVEQAVQEGGFVPALEPGPQARLAASAVALGKVAVAE